MRTPLLVSFLFLLKLSFGQHSHSLEVISSDKPKDFFSRKFSYRTQYKDSLQALQEGKDWFGKLHSFGYLAASIDSIVSDSSQTRMYVYVGDKFHNVILENGNLDNSIVN